MFNIPIQAMRDALRPLLGDRGAREIIIADLGQGLIASRCKSFRGVNPSKWCTFELPDSGTDLDLPAGFWGRAFVDEGEQHFDGGATSANVHADWGAGNFSVAGTHSSGRIPFARAAFDVHLDRATAMARLSALGVDPKSLKAGAGATEEEMLAWVVSFLRRSGIPSQNAAEPAVQDQFPLISRAHARRLYRQGRAQIETAP